ncbi:MAG TPA: tripartite tricarboxylate transporter substrate binding protein [Burkholderiales bacterium]|jgi:tripartite-type tricarboxylate transporter receptor subunit TctC
MKRLAGFVLGVVVSIAAYAQAYPTKPIRLVVPFGPGGVADITARTVTPEVSKGLGQQFVIENKPSAGGAVAGQDVARSAPDGYTLLLINNGTAVSKALFKSLPYDPERDFEMISTVGFFPLVIMTDSKSPFKNLQGFVAAAKKNPGKLNVGTIGIGSTQHLAAELFKSVTGTNFQIIPYKSTGEVVTAAKSGDAAAIFEFLAPMTSHIKSGNLRPLATTVAKRFPTIPDVPTAIEAGVAGYDVASWNGLAAPAKTPRAVIDRLHNEVAKVLASPDIQKRLADLGVDARASTPEELRKFFASETQRWAKVVETAKIPKQ